MLAAWCISVVVIWPILWLFVAIACLFFVEAVLASLRPDPAAREGIGMEISFLWMGPVLVFSAVVAAITCYKTCRCLTASWRESKPFAFEIGTVMATVVAIVAAFAFWACLATLLAVP